MQFLNLLVTPSKAPVRTGITSPFLNLQNHPTLYFNSSYLFCFLSSLFLFRCQVGTIGQSSDTYQFSSLQLQYQADYSPTFCLFVWESPTKFYILLTKVLLSVYVHAIYQLAEIPNFLKVFNELPWLLVHA